MAEYNKGTSVSPSGINTTYAFSSDPTGGQVRAVEAQPTTGSHALQTTQSGIPVVHEAGVHCTACNQACRNHDELGKHGRDQGHKPYACSCGDTFSRKDSLERHVASKSKDTVAQHHCEYCPPGSKAFKRLDHLSQHHRVFHRIHNGRTVPQDDGNDSSGSDDLRLSTVVVDPSPAPAPASAPASVPALTAGSPPALMGPISLYGSNVHSSMFPLGNTGFQGHAGTQQTPFPWYTGSGMWPVGSTELQGYASTQPGLFPWYDGMIPAGNMRFQSHANTQPTFSWPQPISQDYAFPVFQQDYNPQPTQPEDGQESWQQHDGPMSFQGFFGPGPVL
ncbi:hypothetical protein GGR56DRAFT_214363 [Xylariaceae sp. FL0804]|nr:hypothetical protein GGR56DRAFT_214363 [Xylariaceae sp. FL0804]